MTAAPEWVTIAALMKVRGNRGELTAVSFSRPERFENLGPVNLFGDGSQFQVEEVWTHGDHLVFKFRGIDSISDAEKLQGAEVRVPFSQRIELDPGEYFHSDLIGCEVIERPAGTPIGSVTGWQDNGGPGLLVVDGEMLIPFARAICVAIDVAARRIEVELPEGLKDLNAP